MEVAEKFAKKGAQALRQESREKFGKGRHSFYANGWKSHTERVRSHKYGIRLYSTIYNNNEPSIAHLLEHGHVTRNGTGRVYGRTPGHEHIAPVEAELVEAFEREVLAKL